jgi:hypothetical protein
MPVDRVYVYRVPDLQRDAKTFIGLAGLVNMCHGLCRREGNELLALHDELAKDGRIAERLDRPASGRE